jgi:hypothetical protein
MKNNSSKHAPKQIAIADEAIIVYIVHLERDCTQEYAQVPHPKNARKQTCNEL